MKWIFLKHMQFSCHSFEVLQVCMQQLLYTFFYLSTRYNIGSEFIASWSVVIYVSKYSLIFLHKARQIQEIMNSFLVKTVFIRKLCAVIKFISGLMNTEQAELLYSRERQLEALHELPKCTVWWGLFSCHLEFIHFSFLLFNQIRNLLKITP